MNLREYKSGQYMQQYLYKSFTPSKINHQFTWDDSKINVLLSDANRKMRELNVFPCIIMKRAKEEFKACLMMKMKANSFAEME